MQTTLTLLLILLVLPQASARYRSSRRRGSSSRADWPDIQTTCVVPDDFLTTTSETKTLSSVRNLNLPNFDDQPILEPTTYFSFKCPGFFEKRRDVCKSCDQLKYKVIKIHNTSTSALQNISWDNAQNDLDGECCETSVGSIFLIFFAGIVAIAVLGFIVLFIVFLFVHFSTKNAVKDKSNDDVNEVHELEDTSIV
eukprot:m.91622 g.91622  ORF g.91622 m.91622 type:complete len:196 (+) comp13312_c0_seq5:74-661(+)